jgi:hypothetical protein
MCVSWRQQQQWLELAKLSSLLLLLLGQPEI